MLTAIRDLDSSRLAGKHPGVFFTPAEVAAARRRSRSAALRPVFERLRSDALAALDLKLESFPAAWWDEAKSRSWADTYPEVFLHTWVEPSRVARPLEALARCALLSGDDRAREKAREVLLHLTAFSFEPEHYDVGLNYSVWAIHALAAYDALFPHLSAGDRRRLDGFFTRLGRAVLKNDLYWIEHRVGGGINNHLAWHKMMLGMLGLFYEEPAMVEFALHGPRGLVELLELGLTDDGLWCEGSLVYHFAAIVPMMLFADTLRRCRHSEDLFERAYAGGRALRQPMEAMLCVLFPDGTIPPVGDAYGRRPALADEATYELAWSAWRDPRFAWLLSRRRERPAQALFVPVLPVKPAAPPARSRLYPEHGYAFLRSEADGAYWDSDARCAFLTYDRSGVHSNADKLSLMLFGCGRLLLPDVEGIATVPHAFSSEIQRELNRGALSQNTVMVDGRDQRAVPDILDLVEFRDLPAEKRVTAADLRGRLYEGVRQQRTLCLTDRYLLDVFQVAADAPRQLDWVMHLLDERARRTSGPQMHPCASIAPEGAWQWLRDFRSAAADGAWSASWGSGGVYLRLDVLGALGTEVVECGYPATDRPDAGQIPMLLVRRRAAQTVFAVVYTAGREPLDTVALQVLPEREGKLAFAVEVAGHRAMHLVPKLPPGG